MAESSVGGSMMLQVAQRLQNSTQPGTPQLYLCVCARGRVCVLLPCQEFLLLLAHRSHNRRMHFDA